MALEIFQRNNEQIKELVGREFAPGTLERYRTSLDHTDPLLSGSMQQMIWTLKGLDYEFISEYEFWLKSVRHCGHNTAMKYLSNFKKLVLRCVRNGWLQRDPFCDFKMTKKEVVRTALTQQELQIIAGKSFETNRLNYVKDIFLFSCYTGLAYINVKKLKRTEISAGIDGDKWIFTKRQKTEAPSKISLLPMALEIMENTLTIRNVLIREMYYLFRTIKMNEYLREIADLCGISKRLTYHIARHIFATPLH